MRGDVEAEATRALAAVTATIDDLETALVRLDDGRFDGCEVCGAEVEPDITATELTALRCLRHAEVAQA